jgi:hypothetical protein
MIGRDKEKYGEGDEWWGKRGKWQERGKRKEWEVMGGNMTGRMGKGMSGEERGKRWERRKRKRGGYGRKYDRKDGEGDEWWGKGVWQERGIRKGGEVLGGIRTGRMGKGMSG